MALWLLVVLISLLVIVITLDGMAIFRLIARVKARASVAAIALVALIVISLTLSLIPLTGMVIFLL